MQIDEKTVMVIPHKKWDKREPGNVTNMDATNLVDFSGTHKSRDQTSAHTQKGTHTI